MTIEPATWQAFLFDSLNLAFFGSVVRDDFGLHSDVDVLVEFEPGHIPGYDFFLIEAELSGLLGA